MTEGRGGDVVIDATAGAADALAQGMQMVRVRGTVVIGGLTGGKPAEGFMSDWVPCAALRSARAWLKIRPSARPN
jgi:threonine dehydrogenase-like Zn-dependent dehydrogenase